jgi:hypothetical protein
VRHLQHLLRLLTIAIHSVFTVCVLSTVLCGFPSLIALQVLELLPSLLSLHVVDDLSIGYHPSSQRRAAILLEVRAATLHTAPPSCTQWDPPAHAFGHPIHTC